MKTTLMMAAMTLALTLPATALDNGETRSGRPDGQRQNRGPGGPQFRGGEMPNGDRQGEGRRFQGRGGQNRDEGVRSARNPRPCPNCGAPQGKRQGQGVRRGEQGNRPQVGRGPQRGQRGEGYGPQSRGMQRPQASVQGNRGRVGRGDANTQQRPGYGQRRNGSGEPQWNRGGSRPGRDGRNQNQ